MRIKTREEIRQDLLTALNNMLPDLDLTEGTPERDMFIESQISGSLSNIWDGINYVGKVSAPLTYYLELEDVDIDRFCATFGVTARPATRATGVVTFYTSTEPVSTIYINDGTIVNTGGANAVEFSVDGDYTIPYSIRNSYYNAIEERWEIDCNVKAINAGPDYKAGTGTVTRLQTAITGIDGVVNAAPITGGTNTETVASRMTRVVNKFQGRDLGPTAGIQNFVGVYASAVNIVGANDPLMERDEGIGGAIDIYIIGKDLASTTDEIIITSSGLETGTNVLYTPTSIIMLKQPVSNTISVVINDIPLTPVLDYSLVADTGMLSNSTAGSDMVVFTSSGYLVDGDIVELSYNYNSLLETIETALNATTNHFHNRDYLLRSMTEVTIGVYLKIKEVAGQDFTAVAAVVQLLISDFINKILNTGIVELADIVGIAKNYTGVDNIQLTTAALTATGGGTIIGTDVLIEKNQYPVAGVINIVQWT